MSLLDRIPISALELPKFKKKEEEDKFRTNRWGRSTRC